MTALEMLTDLVEDPKSNGDYELHLKGEELRKFWKLVEAQDKNP